MTGTGKLRWLPAMIRVPGAEHGTGSARWDKIDWPSLPLEWFETHLRQNASSGRSR